MKVNEAPEKVYVHKSQYWGLMANEHNITKDGIEYTRTNAFIEKAAEWLEEHKEAVETEDNGIMGWIPDYFIEDFRKYMKGE